MLVHLSMSSLASMAATVLSTRLRRRSGSRMRPPVCISCAAPAALPAAPSAFLHGASPHPPS